MSRKKFDIADYLLSKGGTVHQGRFAFSGFPYPFVEIRGGKLNLRAVMFDFYKMRVRITPGIVVPGTETDYAPQDRTPTRERLERMAAFSITHAHPNGVDYADGWFGYGAYRGAFVVRQYEGKLGRQFFDEASLATRRDILDRLYDTSRRYLGVVGTEEFDRFCKDLEVERTRVVSDQMPAVLEKRV